VALLSISYQLAVLEFRNEDCVARTWGFHSLLAMGSHKYRSINISKSRSFQSNLKIDQLFLWQGKKIKNRKFWHERAKNSNPSAASNPDSIAHRGQWIRPFAWSTFPPSSRDADIHVNETKNNAASLCGPACHPLPHPKKEKAKKIIRKRQTQTRHRDPPSFSQPPRGMDPIQENSSSTSMPLQVSVVCC